MIFGLRVTRVLGPMVNIIFKMLKDVFIFCILLILVLVLFTCIGQVSFSGSTGFDSFFNTFKLLFSAALGDFSFDGYYRVVVFLMIYLLVNLVLMLNLLIALLSNTFSMYSSRSVGLYLKDVIH